MARKKIGRVRLLMAFALLAFAGGALLILPSLQSHTAQADEAVVPPPPVQVGETVVPPPPLQEDTAKRPPYPCTEANENQVWQDMEDQSNKWICRCYTSQYRFGKDCRWKKITHRWKPPGVFDPAPGEVDPDPVPTPVMPPKPCLFLFCPG